jgi:penicillin-binding protein 1A
MGITTEVERFPSSTIGAVEVIPLDVAASYSGFSTLGTRVRPFPIIRVENAEGEVLWEPQPERTQVLDSLHARLMVDLLQDAANRGTGAGLHSPGPDGGHLPYEVPTAGKTGTTNDATDVWFTGFTPNLIGTVWFGMDRPVMITPRATGGGLAAPTWGRFMTRVYYGVSIAAPLPQRTDSTGALLPGADTLPTLPEGAVLEIPAPWPMHPGLSSRQVDFNSGKLWSEWCRGEEYTEYYVPGTEPTEVCDDTGRGIFRLPRIGLERPEPLEPAPRR